MSPAVATAGPSFFRTSRLGPSECCRNAISLMFKTMFVTSSRTPAMDENSLLSLRSFGKTSLREVKRKLADLEGGESCILFDSGMSAVGETVFAYTKSGDHIIKIDGKATAYVCQNYACKAPVTDIAKLKELITQAGK